MQFAQQKLLLKKVFYPGGGIALLNASTLVKSKGKNEDILLKAIKAPYLTILKNAGFRNFIRIKKVAGLMLLQVKR